MRCANSAIYVQKAKAEKQVKQITQKYKEQKLKSIAETSKVVERMQKVCERRTSVAVHDATVHLQRDLTTSIRGEKGLKYTLGKSKVHFCLHKSQKARSSRQIVLMPSRLVFSSLQVENSILLENILQRTVRIKELEIIVKKVPLP